MRVVAAVVVTIGWVERLLTESTILPGVPSEHSFGHWNRMEVFGYYLRYRLKLGVL